MVAAQQAELASHHSEIQLQITHISFFLIKMISEKDLLFHKSIARKMYEHIYTHTHARIYTYKNILNNSVYIHLFISAQSFILKQLKIYSFIVLIFYFGLFILKLKWLRCFCARNIIYRRFFYLNYYYTRLTHTQKYIKL